jgi:hypothetical protein
MTPTPRRRVESNDPPLFSCCPVVVLTLSTSKLKAGVLMYGVREGSAGATPRMVRSWRA